MSRSSFGKDDGRRFPARFTRDLSPPTQLHKVPDRARVFTDSNLEVVTTEEVLGEVRRHLAKLARKVGLPLEEAQEYLSKLPVKAYPESVYQARLGEARQYLADRDPDDVGLAAVALHLGFPIWSNDKDFREVPVELYPTAKLLKVLGL